MKFAKATKFHRKSGGGLGTDPQNDLSAVGAALNLCPLPPVPLGAYSGLPTTLLSSTTTYAAFFEESRMRFTETTKPDRKSGGSRGTCCAPRLPHKGLR